jgi:hypothetical protein
VAAEAGAAMGGDLQVMPAGQVTVPAVSSKSKSSKGVAAFDGGPQRPRLDHRGHVPVLHVVAQFAGAIGGVAEHLGAGGFVIERPRCGLGVADVAGGEFAGVSGPVSGSTATCAL